MNSKKINYRGIELEQKQFPKETIKRWYINGIKALANKAFSFYEARTEIDKVLYLRRHN